jgi:hypothetical protein
VAEFEIVEQPDEYTVVVIYRLGVDGARDDTVGWLTYDSDRVRLEWGRRDRSGTQDAPVASSKAGVVSGLDAHAQAELAEALRRLRSRLLDEARGLPERREALLELAADLEPSDGEPPWE